MTHSTPSFWLGLDLGQAQDYTALAILERHDATPTPHTPTAAPVVFQCRYLERVQLGTPYPAIVERVQTLLSTPALRGHTRLVVDATGVGRPVIDLLRAANLAPVPVMITGGDTESQEGGYWRVPKRDLISRLQVLLQEKAITFAEGMPHVHMLVQELLNFQVKITTSAHDTYGAWREGTHDDLVLAVALAAWAGKRWREPVLPPVQAYGTPVIHRLRRR